MTILAICIATVAVALNVYVCVVSHRTSKALRARLRRATVDLNRLADSIEPVRLKADVSGYVDGMRRASDGDSGVTA